MINTFDTQDFFRTEYTAFSTYDNIRKIANVMDGQKNASRKILHFVMNHNINTFTKVSNLSSRIQDATSYLHGSLEGTVVNNTQQFVGSNNVPMLLGDGTFGTRFITEPAASRYIFSKFNPKYSRFFNADDYSILEHQVFEGDKIEPKYYVPILPLILVNGSNGVSVGFSQKILPRNYIKVINEVHNLLEGKPTKRIVPYFEGFNGKILDGQNENQWIIQGTFERQTKTQLVVTELPIGYDLKGYIDVLESLVDNGKIRAYADESEDDTFRFVIGVTREVGALSDDKIISLLKLSKTITENFTAIDINNRVVDFENELDIIKYWLNVRLDYNEKRKENILGKLSKQINDLNIKAKFIKAVINRNIIIEKRTKDNILEQMKSFSEEIYEYDRNGGDLLRMPLYSITEEKILELVETINKLQSEYDDLITKTANDLLKADLETLRSKV